MASSTEKLGGRDMAVYLGSLWPMVIGNSGEVHSAVLKCLQERGVVPSSLKVDDIICSGDEKLLAKVVAGVREAVASGAIVVGDDGGPCGDGVDGGIEKFEKSCLSKEAVEEIRRFERKYPDRFEDVGGMDVFKQMSSRVAIMVSKFLLLGYRSGRGEVERMADLSSLPSGTSAYKMLMLMVLCAEGFGSRGSYIGDKFSRMNEGELSDEIWRIERKGYGPGGRRNDQNMEWRVSAFFNTYGENF